MGKLAKLQFSCLCELLFLLYCFMYSF